jgi:hypothetical protein
MPTAQKSAVTEDAIRLYAYHLWEQDGRPLGRDLEFWGRAVAALDAKPARPARPRPAAAKPAARSRRKVPA